jgi:hypothetical protein
MAELGGGLRHTFLILDLAFASSVWAVVGEGSRRGSSFQSYALPPPALSRSTA